jgi:hypothetical protein
MTIMQCAETITRLGRCLADDTFAPPDLIAKARAARLWLEDEATPSERRAVKLMLDRAVGRAIHHHVEVIAGTN